MLTFRCELKMNAGAILTCFNFPAAYLKAMKLRGNYLIESFPLTEKRGFPRRQIDLNHGKGSTHRMTH